MNYRYAKRKFFYGWCEHETNRQISRLNSTIEEAFEVAQKLKGNGLRASWEAIGRLLAYEYCKNGRF